MQKCKKEKKLKPKVIVIVGPTASGKTALSIELAKKINGEIVSCDSKNRRDKFIEFCNSVITFVDYKI